jgi:hypothetical protein
MNLIERFFSATIGCFLYTREKFNQKYFQDEFFEKLEIKKLLDDKIPESLSDSIFNFKKRIKAEEV